MRSQEAWPVDAFCKHDPSERVPRMRVFPNNSVPNLFKTGNRDWLLFAPQRRFDTKENGGEKNGLGTYLACCGLAVLR